MDDLISRQDAIDAINELHDNPNAWLDLTVDALEKLPSVQPDYTEWEMREAFNEGYSRGAKAVQEKRETCGLQCLRCKQTYEYTWETMDEITYTMYSYCPDCIRKGIQLLKAQDKKE